ncbi:MAG TPA: FecR domain-containing protein, partial [Puia sp.]|nr:FecR domain-containing protein [Puia sp.]
MGQEQKEHTWDLIAKKLAREATPGELKELEDLLRAHPELYYPLQAVADFWKSSNPGDLEKAEQAFDRHLDRIKAQGIEFTPDVPEDLGQDHNTGHGRRGKTVLVTTMSLLVVLIGFFVVRFMVHQNISKQPAVSAPMKEFSEVATRDGSRTSLTLPDGTHVWLNAGSRLTYDKTYGVQLREVSLTGEALFDVAHNTAKPFVIHTTRVDIKVLGTRFNVKSYPTDKTTEATLLRGSIEVSIKARPDEKIILKPNEKLVIANDDSALHRNLSPHPEKTSKANESLVDIRKPAYDASGINIETSWVDDRLIFQDEAFGSLAKDMQRWYGVSIRFTRPGQEEWRFTGNFRKE